MEKKWMSWSGCWDYRRKDVRFENSGLCGMMEMDYIKRVQLSEIVEVVTKGTTPTTLGYEFQDEGVNFLKIECFNENGGFIESKVAHISEECHKKMKRSQLKNGDILFSIAGAIGRVAIVTEEMLPANINQALAIIRISDEQVYLPYIKLILTSPIVIEQFERKKQGVAQLNLSLKDINEISIPLPGKDKQIELAELFDKVVGVISKRNKELSALDDLTKARFVEMFGSIYDGKFAMKTLPEIVCEEKNSIKRGPFGGALKKGDFVEEGYLVYEQRHAIHNDFEYAKYYISQEKYEDMIGFKVEPEDLIISCSGVTLGRIAEVPVGAKEGIINQALLKLSLNQAIMMNTFFIQQFRGEEIQEILFGFSRGSGIPNMPSMSEVKSVKFICPPLELQRQYCDFVKQVDKSKVKVQKALDETQKLFDSLMQQYFG